MQIVTKVLDRFSQAVRSLLNTVIIYRLHFVVACVSCGHRCRFNHFYELMCASAQLDSLAHFAVNYDGIHNTVWLIIQIIAFVWCQRSIQMSDACRIAEILLLWRRMHLIYEHLNVSWIYNMWEWTGHASTHMTWVDLKEDNFACNQIWNASSTAPKSEVKTSFSSMTIEWRVPSLRYFGILFSIAGFFLSFL